MVFASLVSDVTFCLFFFFLDIVFASLVSQNRLFEYQGDTKITRRLTNFASPLINIPMGFAFDTAFYNYLYFSDNGVIVFQQNAYGAVPTYANPFYFPPSSRATQAMIAPFWANADFSAGMGDLYYMVYDFETSSGSNSSFKTSLENSIHSYFKDVDPSFQIMWALKITWEKAPPYPAVFYSLADTNTYQVVLATDGIYSFCLIMFDDGGMNWNYNSLPTYNMPVMGYYSGVSNGQARSSSSSSFPAFNDPQTASHVSTQQRYRPDQSTGLNTGKKGFWAYRLETNTKNTPNPRQMCLNWYNQEPPPVWAIGTPACPCNVLQGIFDPSFTLIDLQWNYGYNVKDTGAVWSLQSIFPTFSGAGTRCYYGWDFNLIYGEKEKYLPAPWLFQFLWIALYNPTVYRQQYYNHFWNVQLPRSRDAYKGIVWRCRTGMHYPKICRRVKEAWIRDDAG
ncbi:mucin-4-like [Ambystoma mexicanum]|uniref:mucin-4-like n=1 Tax=Ambystoma mexicanum TaxID=8296 RepID=UPI0037E962AF